MKYKVGDRVKVRDDLNAITSYGSLAFISEMDKYKGKIVTIENINDFYRYYEVKECSYGFTDEMLERVDPLDWIENKLDDLEKAIEKIEKEIDMKDFKIIDYRVYDDKVVVVTFDDKTQERAVCCEGDTFDLERGLEVCVLKHIFGKDGYKSMLKTIMKQTKAVDKAKEDKKKEEEEIKRKKAKAVERKARRKENKRKARIAEMKEAYLVAMRESMCCECDCKLEHGCDEFVDDLK